MNTRLNRILTCSAAIACFTALALLTVCINRATAAPRPPGPPLPETGVMYRERFDQPLRWPTNQVIDPSIWVESWSGYALNRQQAMIHPWVVSMVTSNGTYKIDPQRGALRLWYMPNWSSAATGLGSGPGNMARLLTLVSTNGSTSATWWSLIINENGNELHLVCQTENGPAVCLSGAIAFQSGTWHCLAVGYTGTNSALFIDGQQAAVGGGLAAVPAEVTPLTSLVIGSSLAGDEVAAGQLEECVTFTARRRLEEIMGHPFGLDIDWEIGTYYSNYVQVAALGPVTPTEEAAWLERAAASRAARLAAQEAAVASAPTALDGPQTAPYDPSVGFWLLPQTFQGTNILLTLTNSNPNIGYDIYFAPALTTNMIWSIVATGIIGQTTYTLPITGAQGFFRGAEGGDWDGDGIPNWMDADPCSTNLKALTITIDSPINGATLN